MSRLALHTEIIAVALLVFALVIGAATSAQAQTFTVLYSFGGQILGAGNDGTGPQSTLVRDAAGNLYGTTLQGGGSSACFFGCGIVFRVDPLGNETVLHRFTGGNDGGWPFAGLVRDAAGNLYGTTAFGGASSNCSGEQFGGCGTVFKIDTSGNETILHSFAGSPSDGAQPGALIMDAAGNLYGTTRVGGASSSVEHGVPGLGTVFKLDPAGNETVLYSFSGGDGDYPVAGLLMDTAGNLYGTTGSGGSGPCVFGCGTIFKLDASGRQTVLYNFQGGIDGLGPSGSLIMDAAGNLYGTAFRGGAIIDGCGACGGSVFKLDTFGNLTVLHNFTGGNDGSNPAGALLMDGTGNLYGTTSDNDLGVAGLAGTVFKLDFARNETVLHNFTGGVGDGGSPRAALIMDTAGNLYSTTEGGGTFGAGTVFKLTAQLPPPAITTISPTSAIAGASAFTLTVNGANFVSGSTVNFNGNARATTFVSATQLTAIILASDIAIAGTFNVTVTNPGATTSNSVSFTVLTPQQATAAIINSVNALFSQGVLNGGQDNSLVVQLEHAINMMNAGKNAGAIGNLESFISEVNDLLSSGVLSPSQAASLTSAAQSVIARLS